MTALNFNRTLPAKFFFWNFFLSFKLKPYFNWNIISSFRKRPNASIVWLFTIEHSGTVSDIPLQFRNQYRDQVFEPLAVSSKNWNTISISRISATIRTYFSVYHRKITSGSTRNLNKSHCVQAIYFLACTLINRFLPHCVFFLNKITFNSSSRF